MVKGQASKLPPYSVQESQRAKNVYLKISLTGELRVVVPQGFNHKRIPEIVQRKQQWIERATQKLQLYAQPSDPTGDRPTQIELGAIAENWTIEYRPTTDATVTLSEPKNWSYSLLLQGKVESQEACRLALKQWLTQKGYVHLVPWLESVSRQIQLPFRRATVRGQKTRWGSCSCHRNISLNYKLLFLPSAVVRYVLVHELCHTVHLNHSHQFWDLVQAKEPDYRQLDRELRTAQQHLPRWLAE